MRVKPQRKQSRQGRQIEVQSADLNPILFSAGPYETEEETNKKLNTRHQNEAAQLPVVLPVRNLPRNWKKLGHT